MNYRKAIVDDVSSVAILFDSYRVFYNKQTDIDSAKNFILDRIINNDSEIFIAEDLNKKVIGFVQLYPLFSSTRMAKFWLLNDLFVNIESRGKGISIGLINKAKQLVKETKASGMSLETEKSNLIGNNLYSKTGFKLNSSCNFYEWENT